MENRFFSLITNRAMSICLPETCPESMVVFIETDHSPKILKSIMVFHGYDHLLEQDFLEMMIGQSLKNYLSFIHLLPENNDICSTVLCLFSIFHQLFSGERAFGILEKLTEKGNRYYSAPQRGEAIADMKDHFSCPNWNVQIEATDADGTQTYWLENHICRFQPNKKNRVLLGTHYDTRMWAEKSLQPISPKSSDCWSK